MTGEKTEGTIVFDGLIQGRVTDPAVGEKLSQWTEFVGKLGPRFTLELRGGAFSLLPEPHPVSVRDLGSDPAESIRQAVEQLASLFSLPERLQLFSTLRSSEYRPQREVQSVYSISNGQVGVQSRTVEADTVAPPVPLSSRDRMKMAGVGLVMTAVVLGIALLFPGVRGMFREVAETVRPFSVKELTIDVGPYASWIEVAVDEAHSKRTGVALVIKRKNEFPLDDASYASAELAAGADVQRRFALENLGRGFVSIDFYDDQGKYLQTGHLRVVDLFAKESLPAVIGLPERIRVGKLAFVP